MENAVEHIKLTDGVFTAAEAADGLVSLINDKIKFHKVQSLNFKTGYEENKPESEQRIFKLKKSKEIVRSIVVQVHKENYEISIDNAIAIKLTKRKQNQ
jgi:hypothetical protein